mmetsp:Transcript_68001/g.189917  ORF Transcript_68001/g.189917 Transcript_68001/m.189917 type:complete len:285 (+) Transcript_68001:171-1025(+)
MRKSLPTVTWATLRCQLPRRSSGERSVHGRGQRTRLLKAPRAHHALRARRSLRRAPTTATAALARPVLQTALRWDGEMGRLRRAGRRARGGSARDPGLWAVTANRSSVLPTTTPPWPESARASAARRRKAAAKPRWPAKPVLLAPPHQRATAAPPPTPPLGASPACSRWARRSRSWVSLVGLWKHARIWVCPIQQTSRRCASRRYSREETWLATRRQAAERPPVSVYPVCTTSRRIHTACSPWCSRPSGSSPSRSPRISVRWARASAFRSPKSLEGARCCTRAR